MNIYTVSAVCLIYYVAFVNAHGRLLNPPGRSSLWRFKNEEEYASRAEDIKENYNDNQLFCGGFSTQWYVNGGNCGVCGDSYSDPQPRANEAGGTYGTGIITKTYERAGKVDIHIDLTAFHKGYFEFRLCPNNDITTIVKQECLDKHLLTLNNGETRYYPNELEKQVYLQANLPKDVTCTQCVLQWRYHTGNSWGVDENGVGAVGNGPQEEFYGCSDIAIFDNGTEPSTVTPTPSTSTTTAPPTTTEETVTISSTSPKPFFSTTTVLETVEPSSTAATTTSTIVSSSTTTENSAEAFPAEGISRCTAEQIQQDFIQLSCTEFVRCVYEGLEPLGPISCPPGTMVNMSTGTLTCDFSYNTPQPCGTKV